MLELCIVHTVRKIFGDNRLIKICTCYIQVLFYAHNLYQYSVLGGTMRVPSPSDCIYACASIIYHEFTLCV